MTSNTIGSNLVDGTLAKNTGHTEWLTDDQFNEFLVGMLGAEYVAIDTETNGSDIRSGEGFAMGVSVAYDGRSEYFPFRHNIGFNYSKEQRETFILALSKVRCGIFHNFKFDLVSLATLGCEFNQPFYDTMLMAHMINENWASKKLDWLGKLLLNDGKVRGPEFQAWLKAFGWGNIPSEIMWEYAEHDADLTLWLFQNLYPKFKAEGYDGAIWNHKQDFIRVVAAMEQQGVRINTGLCAEQANVGNQKMQQIADDLGFNPGSPTQLGDYLLTDLGLPVLGWTQLDKDGNKTEKSKPSFAKKQMEGYDILLTESDNPTAKQIVEYRGWSKATSVAYEGYPAKLSGDGRLRPNYKLHGTVTGRLSCEEPNLQQIPRNSPKEWDGALKAVFIPADGYELWEADYSQLELRLGAAYAGESGLITEFNQPDSDVFSRMAADLGFSRDNTKTLTYTLQYGGGIRRIKSVFGVSESEAAAIRDNYFATYPGFKALNAKASTLAKRRGYVKTWSGRRRHFQNPEKEAHKAMNSIIQGGAADIVERTMLRLYQTVNGPDCKMLLQVHDSVLFEIRSERVEEYKSLIKNVMEAVKPAFGVRFAVQVKEWGK